MADINRCCGLLTASKDPVPLKGISVDVQVKGFVADVSATLTYKNEEQNPLEAVFVFPMDDDSAVYNFEAMVDGKRIVAEIQEKKQAQETYADAISQGREAFLLEEDSSSGDIFSCSVGNLPPDQEAAVTLSFVQELPLEPDGAVRFVLPTVLNPRYTPRDVETKSVTTGINRVPTGKLPYSLKMTANVISPHGVNRVQSNCVLTPLNYLKEDKTSAQVSLADDHKFDRDVELLIYYNEVNKPSVIVEAGLPNAAPGSLMADVNLMLNFYPNIPESQEQSTCGEFIFLMDRSGSMSCSMGSEFDSPRRIDSAKETMVLLLKSLPLGCYFNIFGFGSHFQSFFPDSVEYTQESMKSALKQIEEMSANMGGTEILEPLKNIYSKTEKTGHPRQLFVFTDGEVGNTKAVIAEVHANSSKHRCFAFGIGEGASTALIKGIARAGHGTFEFVTGKERMQPKVLQTLKCSLQPVVKDVSLKWTLPTGVESVLLSHLPNAIFSGQRSILYAQLKGKIDQTTSADVSLEYTFKGESFRNSLQFSLQLEEESRLPIHRLAAKNVLRDLETGTDSDDKDVKKRILEMSLQSGVICSLTAFIAVNKDLNQPIQGPLVQRNIPLPGGRQYMMGLRHAPMACMAADSSVSMAACFDMSPVCPPPLLAPMMMKGGGFMCRKIAKKSAPPAANRSTQPFGGISLMQEYSTFSASSGGIAVEQKEKDPVLRLISLQNADGSWSLNADFASALGIREEELKANQPNKDINSTVWATVLALIWLHSTGADRKDEWELLEWKALSWVKAKAGSTLGGCVMAGNSLLKASVDLKVFGL
ncbi:von Willebrand factor A domain-containing protein 5A isoform X1 [Pleurodeles waltl]|uniref:von Willebrand factor A domain-containing protein 5A isoform X1 n=1 Tax=Pleurodeles waltl TaxID=8319 RepID=UPI0037099CE8